MRAEELLFTAHKRFATPPAKRAGTIAAASPVAAFIPPPATWWDGGLGADNRKPDERARRAATCALFARWGMYAEDGKHHDGFWRFAAQACAQPVTEEVFRECFGLGYDETCAELGWYLPIAVGETATRKIAPLKPPKIRLHAATTAEVARVRGDWERGEASLLAAHFPEIAAKYRAKAGRTLRTAYAAEPNDPRLAAVLGLYEFETGENSRAAETLTRLAEGQRAFLRNTRLALAAFRVCLERGERREALAFLERALPFAVDPVLRARLEKARAAMAGGTPTAVRP